MRTLVIALLCIGCGREMLPDPTPNTVDDGDVDGDGDPQTGPQPLELCGRDPSTWSWSTPQLMPEIETLVARIRTNPGDDYYDPILSEDGLTLFASSDVRWPWLVYAFTRPSLSASFDHIALVGPEVNVTGVGAFGYQPLASLGTALCFGTYPLQGITAGTPVIVMADLHQSPLVWRGLSIDAQQPGLGDPRLTADGEGIILAGTVNDAGLRHIFYSRRTADGDFAAGTRVAGLTEADDSAPWISSDRRILLFAHSADQTPDASDIWIATRTDPEGPFENAGPLANVNSALFDGEPYVFQSGDTCELYISSMRVASQGVRLYRSVLVQP